MSRRGKSGGVSEASSGPMSCLRARRMVRSRSLMRLVRAVSEGKSLDSRMRLKSRLESVVERRARDL